MQCQHANVESEAHSIFPEYVCACCGIMICLCRVIIIYQPISVTGYRFWPALTPCYQLSDDTEVQQLRYEDTV